MENNLKSNTQNKTKFTNDDLKKLQAYDLDKKIALTLTRIAEFQAKFPHKIYILTVVCISCIPLLYHFIFYIF